MRGGDKGIKEFIDNIEDKHTVTLKEIDRFYDALNNLRYEGKMFRQRNLKVVNGFIEFINNDFLPHLSNDENSLFPFLENHMPALGPMLHFLKGEHREIKDRFKAFERTCKRLEEFLSGVEDQKRIERLRDKGIYLVCLMRQHIQSESESVYKKIRDLKKEEQNLLMDKSFSRQKRIK